MITASAESFTSFVLERQKPMLRFAMVLTGAASDAEELVADVLGRCFERWDRISQFEHLNAYVRRMLVNEFMSRRRRAVRVVSVADLPAVADPSADPAGDHAERDALLRMLTDLPPKQRAAVVLRYYEDLSDSEIAQVMSCRPASVRSNISRALATLRVTAEPVALASTTFRTVKDI